MLFSISWVSPVRRCSPSLNQVCPGEGPVSSPAPSPPVQKVSLDTWGGGEHGPGSLIVRTILLARGKGEISRNTSWRWDLAAVWPVNTYAGTACSSPPATVARKAHKERAGDNHIPRMEVNWGEDIVHPALITGKKQIHVICTSKIPCFRVNADEHGAGFQGTSWKWIVGQ